MICLRLLVLPCTHRGWLPSVAVTGILKGYDQLVNLVLDETVEYLRGTAARNACCGDTWYVS